MSAYLTRLGLQVLLVPLLLAADDGDAREDTVSIFEVAGPAPMYVVKISTMHSQKILILHINDTKETRSCKVNSEVS